MSEDWKNGGFGIYVHWPFCQAKCPYCDFNSHVSSNVDFDDWQAAFILELDRARKTTAGRVVNSVFFGGGTPSLMSAKMIGAILDKISDCWTLANDIEITLEANPTSVEAARFCDFQLAGVNRVSVGIQALNDDDLKRLGRLHSVSEALIALETANRFFDRVSFDIIYARQDQSLEAWEAELDRALSLAEGHLSLYQLTIEPCTAFGQLFNAGKLRGLPVDDLSADMYAVTQSMCKSAVLLGYETSNHANPGNESRHNMIYWRYGDYLGIGPGAHGRITRDGKRVATESFLLPQQWLSQVSAGSGFSLQSTISAKDQSLEYLMMSLRLSEGTELDRLNGLDGSLVNLQKINELVGSGHLLHKGNRIIATEKGRVLLNSVLGELIM